MPTTIVFMPTTFVFKLTPTTIVSVRNKSIHFVRCMQLRSEGKDYVVKEGDVMLFRFNV